MPTIPPATRHSVARHRARMEHALEQHAASHAALLLVIGVTLALVSGIVAETTRAELVADVQHGAPAAERGSVAEGTDATAVATMPVPTRESTGEMSAPYCPAVPPSAMVAHDVSAASSITIGTF